MCSLLMAKGDQCMFVDNSQFPFTALLESHWRQIRQEYIALPQEELCDRPETQIYTKQWQVYGLYWDYQCLIENAIFCPETIKVLGQIPTLVNAGFSILGSGCEIHPHIGDSDEVLRVHLPLTQTTKCGLRIGKEVRNWQIGECLVFDDRVENEAWNLGLEARVVLLMDVERKGCFGLKYLNSSAKDKGLLTGDRGYL